MDPISFILTCAAVALTIWAFGVVHGADPAWPWRMVDVVVNALRTFWSPWTLEARNEYTRRGAAELRNEDPAVDQAALDALTPLDVAILTGLGWDAPAAVKLRTDLELERALRVPRPPRKPASVEQRALAEMTDRRLQRGGTPSLRQHLLAQEADRRIARGQVVPGDLAEVHYPGMAYADLGLHAEAERRVAEEDAKLRSEIQAARADHDRWAEALRKEKAAVTEMEARVKLDQALGRAAGVFGLTPGTREPLLI